MLDSNGLLVRECKKIKNKKNHSRAGGPTHTSGNIIRHTSKHEVNWKGG